LTKFIDQEDSIDPDFDFVPKYGSELGSILSLLAKANIQWVGSSADVTPWTSPDGVNVQYLPDTSKLIEWLSNEPIS
jgi:hypothetical protein